MSAAGISEEGWEAAWSADLDVLRSLRKNGDHPEVARLIDFSFRGELANLRRLARSAANWGFSVQSLEDDDDGKPWLFLERVQTIEEDAMREFAETYLQFEDAFGVECDGWGCLASNENGPISNENPA